MDFGFSKYFYGYLLHNTNIFGLRSHPIEYYTQGYNNYIDEISLIASHENTYLALDTLTKMFKLDDFASQYDLLDLANDIINTQFLNGSYYYRFGGFSYLQKYDGTNSEKINKKIFCDYTYYAIKCLETIADYYSLPLTDLSFDITALYSYLDRNIVTTTSEQYFNPRYSNDINIILRCTYYMAYMLIALDMYDRDTQKIENFVISNLNYENIENIYYCYKISELLDLDIHFNYTMIQSLVPSLFNQEFNDFSISTNSSKIKQEIFLWICEMARNSKIVISALYNDEVYLGSYNEMTGILQNLVLTDFGTYITFKFESSQTGTITFDKMPDDSYHKQIQIPLIPQCYPEIHGVLRAYEGSNLKAELPISFSTIYNITYELITLQGTNSWNFQINSSILSSESKNELTFGDAYVQVYVDGTDRGAISFSHVPYVEYSLFTLEYIPQIEGDYSIQLFLDDGFNVHNIGNISFTQGPIIGQNIAEIGAAIPLTISLMVVPGTTIFLTSKKLKKKSKLK
jgi:hypothetical protein